jgi:glutamyl-tRNA synthetase
MLAMLGWNPGTEQELFSLQELLEKFSIERVHKGGAKFDFEKAKWFNSEWIKKTPIKNYELTIKQLFEEKGITIGNDYHFIKVLDLVKDRCTVLPDFVQQADFFFQSPEAIDIAAIQPKWDDKKQIFS